MIKVLNNDSGKIEEIEDGGLPDLIDSGKVSVLKGQELEFEDNEGQRRIVPSEQIFEAMDAGFKHVPQKQVQHEELVKESAEQPLLAAGVSGLSGLTLGLSNQILAKSGIVSPEKLKALEEGNPIISTASEIAGGVAPLFLTGGAGLGAKIAAATPVALAERAGMAAALKAAPLTGKILSKTASRVTKEVVENAVKYGAGSAVEGALYGLGNLVNEEALGDAEFNAENALAAMGSNALLGGAFGAGAGAGVAMVGAGARGIKQQYNNIRKKMVESIEDTDVRKEVLSKLSNEESADEILKKLGASPDDLADKIDLEKSAQRLGVPLTTGMKEGGVFAGLEGSLAKEPSIGGILTRKEIDKTYKALDDITDLINKDAADVDSMTIGTSAKNSIKAKISEELEPASLLFEEVKEKTADLPITESLKKRFKTMREKDPYSRIYEQGAKFIDNVDNLQNYSDVTNYRSFVGKELTKAQRAGDGNAVEFFGNLYDNLTTLRTNAIEYNLKARPFVSKQTQITDLLDAQKLADKMYHETHKKFEYLGDLLGVKSRNMSNLMDRIDDIDDRVLSEKIFNLKKLDEVRKFQTHFPEISDLSRAKMLNDMKNKAMTDGVFSHKKFKTILNKMDDVDLQILAPHIKDVKQIKADYSKIVDNLPPNIGPSGTPQGISFQNMFQIPYQAREAFRYAVYRSGPNSMLGQMMNGIPMSGAIEKASNKGKKSISDAVDAFYKKSSDLSIKSINRIITGQDLGDKDIKKIEDKMELYQQSPEEIVNNFTKNNKQLYGAAPKTSEALQSKIMNAAQFLSSKIPKKQVTPFNDGSISRSELLKFKNYVDAVEDPFKVLDTIKAGYVAPEYMEAFSAVYPKMAEKVKEEFAARLPEFKNLTEKQKADLTKILGIDARKAYSPAGFQTLQGISSQGVQKDLANNQQKQSKVPVSAAKNIGQAGRAQSGLDRVLYRK
jgi:hypothetical protein